MRSNSHDIGDRVLTPSGPGAVKYRRMAPPDYATVAAYSVVLDSKRTAIGYDGTIFTATDVLAYVEPIEWLDTTRERYHEMLEILPPELWIGGAFLVGEPVDSNAYGAPRYDAYLHRNGAYYVASRPLTCTELYLIAKGGQ